MVVTRATARGTHTGEYRGLEFKGIPPTGKQVTWTETEISRIRDGKIVESWFNDDSVSRLQQIGALPTPGQAS
jgi:predicted ester cyclase